MKVKVNTRTLELFEGAKVRNALQRYFTVKKLDRKLMTDTEVYDSMGHQLDHDAPLQDGMKLSAELPKETRVTTVLSFAE